jgi:hypothetical protein
MAKKKRLLIPENDAAIVLFEADHACCKCRCNWKPVQIHHIDDDPSNNDRNNLAVLCLECHEQTQVRGGFGRKLLSHEVRQYRDDWRTRVDRRRNDADARSVSMMTRAIDALTPHSAEGTAVWTFPPGSSELPSQADLGVYVRVLPQLRIESYKLMYAEQVDARPESADSYYSLLEILERVLVKLLSYYPQNHFAEAGPDAYASSLVAARTHWHYLRMSQHGVGNSGSLVPLRTTLAVIKDLEQLIEQTVATLTGADLRSADADEQAWHAAWREPVQRTGA